MDYEELSKVLKAISDPVCMWRFRSFWLYATNAFPSYESTGKGWDCICRKKKPVALLYVKRG